MTTGAPWSTLNGERTLTGSLYIPRVGVWVADVALALSTVLAPPVVLTVGSLTLQGTIYRQGAYGGSRGYRIVGGTNGWGKALAARSYVAAGGVSSALVLGDLATEAGERVAVATPSFLGTSFVRLAGPASRTLTSIEPNWWVDATGTTQVGLPRDTSPITSDFTATHRFGAHGIVEIATENEADWMPGRVFSSAIVTTPQTIQASRFTWDRGGRARVEVVCQ